MVKKSHAKHGTPYCLKVVGHLLNSSLNVTWSLTMLNFLVV